ncbi:MAG: GNAT family N-acetyltransferase [Pseudomonadota bacterium]
MWDDLEQLFEERGGPKSCWCMVWRDYERPTDLNDKAARKIGMQGLVRDGEKVGLIAFQSQKAIAWCSVAPRDTFKKSLDGNAPQGDGETWSLTCLFVKRAHRGEGLSVRLIEAAIEYARSQGATSLDAYPVDPESPSYRFCGFKPQFDRCGFATVAKVGSRRHLVRRVL